MFDLDFSKFSLITIQFVTNAILSAVLMNCLFDSIDMCTIACVVFYVAT